MKIPIKIHVLVSMAIVMVAIYAPLTNAARAATCSDAGATLGPCTNTAEWSYDEDNSTYIYCNGSDYISVASDSTLTSCSSLKAATLDFDPALDNLKYCNGTNWIALNASAAGAACPTVGQLYYNTSDNVYNLCTVAGITEITAAGGNSGSLSVSGNTEVSFDGVPAGTYTDTQTLTLSNTGSCDQEISAVTATPANACSTNSGFPFCGPESGDGGWVVMDNSTCSGTLTAGNTCSIVLKSRYIVPDGGDVQINGTLTITTGTLSHDTSLRVYACADNSSAC